VNSSIHTDDTQPAETLSTYKTIFITQSFKCQFHCSGQSTNPFKYPLLGQCFSVWRGCTL